MGRREMSVCAETFSEMSAPEGIGGTPILSFLTQVEIILPEFGS